MKKLFCLFLGCLLLASCGSEKLNFGKSLVKVNSMTDILTEIKAKTSDVGIMDSIMARYYMSNDNSFSGSMMIIEDLILQEEEYGIACRKQGAYTAAMISNTIIDLTNSGKVDEIASAYGLENEVVKTTEKIDLTGVAGKDDFDYILNKGELIIGYTVFAPIAYSENGSLKGFDIDLAKAVCENLGIVAKFQEIDWDNKEIELNGKEIDCIWNGLTITEERKTNMSITVPYMLNKQVAVIRIEDKDKYKTLDDMGSAIIVCEAGSAGQDLVTK